jgi:hypothetical protein
MYSSMVERTFLIETLGSIHKSADENERSCRGCSSMIGRPFRIAPQSQTLSCKLQMTMQDHVEDVAQNYSVPCRIGKASGSISTFPIFFTGNSGRQLILCCRGGNSLGWMMHAYLHILPVLYYTRAYIILHS